VNAHHTLACGDRCSGRRHDDDICAFLERDSDSVRGMLLLSQ
jgi:hypothetical protein